MSSLPRIAILVATFNGLKYLPQQLRSLLMQKNVDIKIIISDDFSTDGTWQFLQSLNDVKISVLPRNQNFKSASGNFFYLLTAVHLTDFDFIGLCDQDDIWDLDKLERELREINRTKSDACSSDVTAFWGEVENPIRTLYVRKSQPMGKWNHLFESAGPGCTFLMTNTLAQEIRKNIILNYDKLIGVSLHDWLFFSLACSANYKWVMLTESTLHYRQHSTNVIGVNSGWKSYTKRIGMLLGGWYRNQILIIANLSGNLNTKPLVSLQRLNFKDLIFLLSELKNMRRKRRDQIVLGVYFIYLFVSRV